MDRPGRRRQFLEVVIRRAEKVADSRHPDHHRHGRRVAHYPDPRSASAMVFGGILLFLLSLVITKYTFIGVKRYLKHEPVAAEGEPEMRGLLKVGFSLLLLARGPHRPDPTACCAPMASPPPPKGRQVSQRNARGAGRRHRRRPERTDRPDPALRLLAFAQGARRIAPAGQCGRERKEGAVLHIGIRGMVLRHRRPLRGRTRPARACPA